MLSCHGSPGRGSAARPPPPVAAPLASSLRAPSRGDPPHDGPAAACDRVKVLHDRCADLVGSRATDALKYLAVRGGQMVQGRAINSRARSDGAALEAAWLAAS